MAYSCVMIALIATSWHSGSPSQVSAFTPGRPGQASASAAAQFRYEHVQRGRTTTLHDAGSKSESRRDVIEWVAASATAIALPSVFVPPANAAEIDASTVATSTSSSDANDDDKSVQKLLTFIEGVPTFTIVDKRGVPFMVVGDDAKVTAYFFTEYDEASRILKSASTSADNAIKEAKRQKQALDPDQMVNPWKDARISTVPLETAITLALDKPISRSTRNYFFVSPSEEDVSDALELTKQSDLAENKVPLFYINDFLLEDGKTTPLYFRKSQLVKAYNASRKARSAKASSEPMPPILVTELFATLRTIPTLEDPLKLVALPNVAKRAEDCRKRGGAEPPLRLGERNLVL